MKLQQTTQKSHHNIIDNVAKRIFKYLGNAPKERRKQRLETLKGEKAKLERLEISRSRKNGGLTIAEACQLERFKNEIELLTEPKPKPELKGKSYPVKDYLLSRSWLVDYNEREASGHKLTKAQEYKADRIYAKRDRAMRLICFHLESYYNTVSRGDYRFDGMPEIQRGIKGWIERKIWRLLVAIGEPNNARFQTETSEYWEEAK
jgi:hypothetical protein